MWLLEATIFVKRFGYSDHVSFSGYPNLFTLDMEGEDRQTWRIFFYLYNFSRNDGMPKETFFFSLLEKFNIKLWEQGFV